ncbi:conjugal transfer protein [Streptomyces sp. NPDC052225]|uniref:conjugal transfer protein n=1 Tax=Streptomyces sp. NPDC052225 TaxID=3154949 RepID=UPI0034312C1A
MNRTLNAWQIAVLSVATVLMVAVGGFGGWGTYSNVQAQFHRGATAAGVVAAGEGLALVLALVLLCLTMLGQSSPAVVRVGLWLAPVGACATGVMIARTTGEAVVYALTPMAMSGAAEGLGLIARRVNIYRTGIDAEAQARNASLVQQIAYQRAAAENHPDEDVRESALRKSWTLAKKAGRGDAQLGADLVGVQRGRLTQGADRALAGMYGGQTSPKEVSRDRSAQAVLRAKFAEMDPVDAVRIVRDALPDATPAQLAADLTGYGLPIDAVQVALVLGERPAEYRIDRPDAGVAPKVSELDALNLQGAIEEAATAIGDDASPRLIAEHLEQNRRLLVPENHIRTALSRAAKKAEPEQPATDCNTDMEGGYA